VWHWVQTLVGINFQWCVLMRSYRRFSHSVFGLLGSFFIKLRRLPWIFHEWSIVSTYFFQTVSFVFEISNAIVIRCWLRLNAELMFMCNVDKASIVEWFFLKPHCSLEKSLDYSMVQIRRLFIIFSKIHMSFQPY